MNEQTAIVQDFGGMEPSTGKKIAYDANGNQLVDYRLNTAPPIVKSVAKMLREEDIIEIRREAVHQWPERFIEAHKAGWDVQADIQARECIVAAGVGIVLGVTKLSTIPITRGLKAAQSINDQLVELQKKEKRKEALFEKRKEQARKENRAKNKVARAARKANRK